jgi:hypothetical protein
MTWVVKEKRNGWRADKRIGVHIRLSALQPLPLSQKTAGRSSTVPALCNGRGNGLGGIDWGEIDTRPELG